jgi:exodeoxyribonuclease III
MAILGSSPDDMALKIATWNVNSIRSRQDRVLGWVRDVRPDILCLQEIKVEDAGFPVEEFAGLGYQAATYGQRTYNGVAILARGPLGDVERGFPDGGDETQSRFIAATTLGVRVMCAYVPNGQAPGTSKYAYKLGWMDRLRIYLDGRVRADQALALCGDFNVAPGDLDVYDPVAWKGAIMCSDDERRALERIREVGLVDALRKLHPDMVVYTWWDYRGLSFPRRKGLRIDHILVTPRLAGRAVEAAVDRNARKGVNPSDHAPLTVSFLDDDDATAAADDNDSLHSTAPSTTSRVSNRSR